MYRARQPPQPLTPHPACVCVVKYRQQTTNPVSVMHTHAIYTPPPHQVFDSTCESNQQNGLSSGHLSHPHTASQPAASSTHSQLASQPAKASQPASQQEGKGVKIGTFTKLQQGCWMLAGAPHADAHAFHHHRQLHQPQKPQPHTVAATHASGFKGP